MDVLKKRWRIGQGRDAFVTSCSGVAITASLFPAAMRRAQNKGKATIRRTAVVDNHGLEARAPSLLRPCPVRRAKRGVNLTVASIRPLCPPSHYL